MKPMRFILIPLMIHSGSALALNKAGATLPESTTAGSSLLQVFLGLVVVLLMIGGVAWLARRFGSFHSGASGSLRILGGLSMGPRERVVLLQVGEKQLLLGVAPGRVSTLHVLDKPVPVAPATNMQGENFATRLAAVLKQGRQS
jgi:flagellar protein FliO/FliZ